MFTDKNTGKKSLLINKEVFVFSILLISLILAPTSHLSADPNSVNPVITSINPSRIHYSDEVEIIGTGFGENGMNNGSIVFMTGTTQGQKILSWTDTKIRVSVNNAVLGNITLTVGARDANGSPVYSNAYPITIEGSCVADVWTCSQVGQCNYNGIQTRTCTKTFECDVVDTPMPQTSYSCTPPPCFSDTWNCSDWTSCSASGNQTRNCNLTFDCPSVATPSPSISQSCIPPTPTCTADIWSCDDWNQCSGTGRQTRSCTKTFDCSQAETPSPETIKYCTIPSVTTPQQQIIIEDPKVSIYDNIIKSTVKLICPLDKKSASQGSGTLIDSSGSILTNRHVIEKTAGCYVGFINDLADEPNFSEVAFVDRISKNEDIALLKIDNKDNRSFPHINFANFNIKNLKLGNQIIVLGFPGIGGAKLTYASGDFSGFGSKTDGLGNYIKTTAPLEYGNSGGGAYTGGGSFIGIPSIAIRGKINSIGYILSINAIIEWVNSSEKSDISYKKNNKNNISLEIEDVTNDQNDLEPPDLSNTQVFIYSGLSKKRRLQNSSGVKQTIKKPLFQISGAEDQGSGIDGYYVYFGKNINANPSAVGKFITTSEFSPSKIKRKGIYYFIFRAVDLRGNISESYITEYRYKI